MLMTKESEQKDGNSWGTLYDEQTRENELSQLPKKEEQNSWGLVHRTLDHAMVLDRNC